MGPRGDAGGVRQEDVREMLGFVSDLASLEQPEEFRRGVLPGLRKLVPCEIASYNEIEFAAQRMISLADPPDSLTAGATKVFIRFGHQNPLVTLYQRTRDGRPYKWSDLMTRRDLHRTDLYRLAYAQMGVEYQIAFALPAPPEMIIAFALNRGRRDFSERDRELLNLIRGPMIQAYRTVERYAALVDRLAAMEQGLERAGTGVVILERGKGGREASFVSEEAARMLELDGRPRLPAEVQGWLGGLDRGTPGEPLIVERSDGTRAAVQWLPARRPGDADALLVEPAAELVSIATLRAAGLTPREAEVLRLAALGQSNREIGEALAVSPRTVQKHLEHIYEKLGARSRVQAILTAWSIARPARV